MDEGFGFCCMRDEEEGGELVYQDEGPGLGHVIRIEVGAHEGGS